MFRLIINPNAFGKLSDANKASLMKASGEAGSALFGKAWDAADEKSRNSAKQRGNLIQTLAPAELARWRPLLEFVTDEWLKKAQERGLDGPKMLDDLQAMIKASSS